MTEQPPAPADTRRSTRRLAAFGLTAGLLGGGTIGLFAAMPSATSAGEATAPAASVALAATPDSTPDTTTAGTTTAGTTTADDTTAARPPRSERIRTALQGLVDDATINATQADAVAEHLAEQTPERRGRRGGKGHRVRAQASEALADVLGIDAETLRTQLRDGSSIADIAAADGIDVDTVIDALVAQASERLDAAVAEGRLTADEAAEKLERATARITARVNGERTPRG